jgi:protein-S-isoprenylcysteine O-methyltransferase Ste14
MAMSRTTTTVIIIACWGTTTLVWIVAGVYFARRAGRVRERAIGRAVPFAFVVLVVLALLPIDWRVLDLRVYWIQMAGAAILAASTLFAMWARLVLGAMWSPVATARQGHELRTTGPYAVTRHPIYTSLIGMLLGSTLLSGSGIWVPILLAGTVLLWTKAATEERLLRRAFGEAYVRYQGHVPRLIPVLRRLGARTRSA